jgi:hypothetical protein
MWRTLSPRTQDTLLNLGVGMAGAVLILSPWLLGFADMA